MSNLTIRISDELKAQFIQRAKTEGTTATALIQKWMHDYINNALTVSTNSTNNAPTNNTNTALTNKLESLESQVKELAEANEYQAQQQEATTNYLNDLRDRVADLEQWKEPINDSLQTDQQSISTLKEKVEALESSTNTALISSTNKDETPTNKESTGVEAQDGEVTIPQEQEQHGETTIPQDKKDKNLQYKTNSTNTALTQEALAKRLKISGRGLANHRQKGNEHLAEWTRERDPDGIAWKYESKKYHPISKA